MFCEVIVLVNQRIRKKNFFYINHVIQQVSCENRFVVKNYKLTNLQAPQKHTLRFDEFNLGYEWALGIELFYIRKPCFYSISHQRIHDSFLVYLELMSIYYREDFGGKSQKCSLICERNVRNVHEFLSYHFFDHMKKC